MQKYELIFVLRADQAEAESQARVEKVTAILAEHQGATDKIDRWGLRRLAYEIDHQNQGDYTFVKFHAEGAAVAEIDRLFRQDDLCLRHMVVVDEEWAERNRAAQARRARAAAAPAAAAPAAAAPAPTPPAE